MTGAPYHRRLRLVDYDYAQAGIYFVTICTQRRECSLGTVADGEMRESRAGRTVHALWQGLEARFPGLALDHYAILPNHLHGLLVLPDSGPTGPWNLPLGEIIRAFKAASAHQIRKDGLPDFGWQRNYYEHVVRNEADLNRIREYIANNPLQWHLDAENTFLS